MHSPRKALLIGNSQQQGAERFAFFRIECHKQRSLVLSRYLSDLFECLGTGMCQVQGIQTSIFRMGSSLDEASFLERVQERDKPAGMNAKAAG